MGNLKILGKNKGEAEDADLRLGGGLLGLLLWRFQLPDSRKADCISVPLCYRLGQYFLGGPLVVKHASVTGFDPITRLTLSRCDHVLERHVTPLVEEPEQPEESSWLCRIL